MPYQVMQAVSFLSCSWRPLKQLKDHKSTIPKRARAELPGILTGGGFKDFLYPALLGEIIQFDSTGLKQTTNYS